MEPTEIKPTEPVLQSQAQKIAMEKEAAFDAMYGNPPQYPDDPVYMVAYHKVKPQ